MSYVTDWQYPTLVYELCSISTYGTTCSAIARKKPTVHLVKEGNHSNCIQLVSHMTNCISSESVHSVHTSNWWSGEPGCHCIKLLHAMTDLRKNLILTWLWNVCSTSIPLLLGHLGIWENYSNLLVIPYHHCRDAMTFQYNTLCWEPLLEWVLQSALHRGSTENISRLFTETSSNLLYSVASAAQCAATLSTSAPLQVYLTRILGTKHYLMKKRSI